MVGRCPAPTRERFCRALPCTRKGAMRGSASRTARKLFEKSFLDLQKLLKMGVIYPPPRWRDVFIISPLRRIPPPPRRKAPSNKNNALTSLVQARLGQALFLLLVLRTRSVGETIFASAVGVGALDDPFKRLSKTAFDAQTKRFSQTKAFPCEGRGTAIAVDE